MFISGLVLWQTEGNSALIGLWVCGSLVFIPGFYFTRIAYKAYKGHRGYSWEDIPEMPYAVSPALRAGGRLLVGWPMQLRTFACCQLIVAVDAAGCTTGACPWAAL